MVQVGISEVEYDSYSGWLGLSEQGAHAGVAGSFQFSVFSFRLGQGRHRRSLFAVRSGSGIPAGSKPG